LLALNAEEYVIASGVRPRVPDIEGITHSKVLSCIDVIQGSASVGESVAIIGAGGIGFDVATCSRVPMTTTGTVSGALMSVATVHTPCWITWRRKIPKPRDEFIFARVARANLVSSWARPPACITARRCGNARRCLMAPSNMH